MGEAATRLQERWLARPATTGAARAGLFVGGLVVTGLVGLLDIATGSRVSFGLLYLIPIAVGTILVGAWGGLCMAAAAATLWVVGDVALTVDSDSLWDYAWNLPLRFGILSLVVALLAALRGALRRSLDGERRTREFLAYAAHQLRTPVAAMRANAEALLSAEPGAEPERLLSNLITESGRVGRLVASLLRVVRLDQDQPPRPAVFDLVRSCQEEVDRAALLTPHEVMFEVGEPVTTTVIGDAEGFREALANVLDNSRRHAQSAVRVRIAHGRGVVLVTVRDDGPGLPEALGDQIFDRFVSLDGRGGSGLGLAIARELLRRQGGDIAIRDRGVELRLPASAGPDITGLRRPRRGGFAAPRVRRRTSPAASGRSGMRRSRHRHWLD